MVVDRTKVRLVCYNKSPVAPVAYHVILEPGIGQFHEFESPRVSACSYKFVGTFSCPQIDIFCGIFKRESVS